MLKVPTDVARALSPEEESKLLEAAAKADSAAYTAVVLAVNTAMRKDEVRKLRWNQIDRFQGVLTVGKSKTDAGTGRVIPLNPSAVKALADWGGRFPNRQPGHYVFPWCESGQVEPLRPTKGWGTAWRNACKRAALDSIATPLPEPLERHRFLRVMCTKLVTKSECLKMLLAVGY